MQSNQQYSKGQASFISIIAALVISVLGGYIFLSRFQSDAKTMAKQQKKVIAEAYVTELLEFFRAFSKTQLANYLSTNPANPISPPYAYCTEVNNLVRITPTTTPNPDPLASLPTTPLDNGTALLNANRSYQIMIVNKVHQQPISFPNNQCAQTALNLTPTLDQTYQIRVTVTWVPPGGTPADEQKVFATTYLTEE